MTEQNIRESADQAAKRTVETGHAEPNPHAAFAGEAEWRKAYLTALLPHSLVKYIAQGGVA